MTLDNPNRYRVSTKFTIFKIGILVGLFSIGFNLVKDFRNDTFTSESLTGLTLGGIALTGIIYFISTRKRIDYDDIKQTLYIVDTKKQTETQIPVDKIDKILYSAIGGRGQNSYIIVYHDFHNQKQKLRLFTIPFDNSVDTIISDAKFKNPALLTRKWSFGWNEFFD